ncbi:MAG TPA: winged helix-turn-helix domain-containing protein [Vicinamibacterales bacterium]|nr:winged helix-turn-helix domain-containing protein [Vicinamibacterales bacterium]
MADSIEERYAFGPFHLDAAEGVLLRDGAPVALPPKVFATLLALVRRHGHVVSRDALVREVWPDTFVEDGNLTQNISVLRKVLGADAVGRPYLETVPKRGYRFTAIVTPVDEPSTPPNVDASSPLAPFVATPAPALTIRGRWRRALAVGVGIAALIAATESWRRASSEPRRVPIRSLAVLPFRSLPPVDGDYLGIGITDTLVSRLSAIREIVVRPTIAVTRFRDAGEDAMALAKRLNVDAILDGHVQRRDQRLRVTAQFMRGDDGRVLWSLSFDQTFDDVFRIEDEIAERVTQAVLGASAPRDRSATRFTPSAEAYEAYMRARHFLRTQTRDDVAKSIDAFQSAVRREPDYALAYAGLSAAYRTGEDYVGPRMQFLPLARAAAERAVALDGNLAEAHAALGMVLFADDWDWKGAEHEFRRAMELNSGVADSYSMYGMLLATRRHFPEALVLFERGHSIDPLSLPGNSRLGYALFLLGRYGDAIAVAQRTLQLEKDFFASHGGLCAAYEAKGEFDEAVEECKKAVELAGYGETWADLGYAYARAGDAARAREVLDGMTRLPATAAASGVDFAVVLVGLGDYERAIAALEDAVAKHAERAPGINYDPRFKPLYANPRFSALLRRMNLLD